ncbi:hypothetical protein M569_17545 [Genlisea aurea]|uniref:Uncharacterized protein n=1 Tax=Genlisea aurea TaxID=192259 RepID=S8BRM2_9LAMI|nr:hypothetical protein M569_17545 [Genlisea aurea]
MYKKLKRRKWPYYHRWLNIFGQDRACGADAQSFNDACQHLEAMLQEDTEQDVEHTHTTTPIAGGTPGSSDYGDPMDMLDTEPNRRATRKKRRVMPGLLEDKALIDGIVKAAADAFQNAVHTVTPMETNPVQSNPVETNEVDIQSAVIDNLLALNLDLNMSELMEVCNEFKRNEFMYHLFHQVDTYRRVNMVQEIVRKM